MGNSQCTDKSKGDDVIVCRCEEVYLSEIKKAIEDGADNLEILRRLTRASMGLCQGRTCGRLLRSIFAQYTGKDISEIAPTRIRPPVRPISLQAVGEGTNSDEFQDPDDTSGYHAPKYVRQIMDEAYGGDGPVVL